MLRASAPQLRAAPARAAEMIVCPLTKTAMDSRFAKVTEGAMPRPRSRRPSLPFNERVPDHGAPVTIDESAGDRAAEISHPIF
jgi:hypothetical protein